GVLLEAVVRVAQRELVERDLDGPAEDAIRARHAALLEQLDHRAVEARVLRAVALLDLLEADLGSVRVDAAVREVAARLQIRDRPRERVRVLGAAVGLLAGDDAEERGEQRELTAPPGLEVRVDVPPLC